MKKQFRIQPGQTTRLSVRGLTDPSSLKAFPRAVLISYGFFFGWAGGCFGWSGGCVGLCSRRRAGDSGGSRRFLGLPLRAEIRIPAPEGILPLFVERPSSYLQEEMFSKLVPSHLLLFMLDQRPVAVIVYEHGNHLINLFVWPVAASRKTGWLPIPRHAICRDRYVTL